MCEIIMVFLLCKNIAAKASEKGRSGFGYGALMFVTWFAGEILGAIIGVIVSLVLEGGQGEPNLLIVLVCAYGFAIAAAVLLFVIVNNLPDVREDYPLRDREYGGLGDDRDYGRRFGATRDPDDRRGRDDVTGDPGDRPRREDDRYKTE
jgi:hypothetical protein